MACYLNASCSYPTTGTAPQIFSSALQFFATAQCLINPDPLPQADVISNPFNGEYFDFIIVGAGTAGCVVANRLTENENVNVLLIEAGGDAREENGDYFDFIIVGAGTAGCVIANRLTENENVNVLLIEAGGDAPEESRIPGLDKGIFGTKYDWQYLTTNDGRINKANKNGSINWPRGKMLGGSSNINAMIYIKGRRYEYEEWFKAGNVDWHPDVVEAYFKKAESYQDQELLKDKAVYMEYGHDGPLNLNKFNSTLRDLTNKIVNSWQELGIPKVVDLNIPGKIRSGITTATAANGVRQSSEIAYIYPVQKRPNLKILKNTFVRKILIDNFARAYGVEAECSRKTLRIYAVLEIIISAGSINSPQLLMLSGVGPKEHLESQDIVCKVDSPQVGQNLQDHIAIPVTIYGNGPEAPDIATQNFGAIQYLYNRTGYLAQSSITDILAFYSSSNNSAYPEYQNHVNIFWKNMSSTTYRAFSERFRFKEPVPSSIAKLNENYTLYEFMFNLLHPESRGNISLRSNDPHDHPLIYPNYFSKEKDLDSAVIGIKMITKIVNTKYFKSINAFLGRIKWPECDRLVLDSDDYWKCICMNMVLTVYHPVGTCKMGPDPNTAVVDSHLRVHGVIGLRVIDASVMPIITSGNTNGPTYMIGERGADLVKPDHYLYSI